MARDSDGHISFDILFDASKMMQSINNSCKRVQRKFEDAFNRSGESAANAIQTSNDKINAILNDAGRSAKSKAASIAAIYRNEGKSQEEAFKEAWAHIERDSASGSEKVKKSIKGIFTQSQKTAKNVENRFSAMAKKIASMLAIAFSVRAIVNFGKSCIDLGSDLQEVQNVVDVTFPNMSKRVDKFAKDAASSFGLSETMAKKFSGTFGAMAKAFGFSESEAYNMGTALTGLAGDVASFYNITQDEAYTKLKSVFTGETESLKDLGVVMTQTALDAYALANGYGKTTKAMSEAEKVALRYAFVQNQLNAASGDFMRTSDGWANQVRVLQLRFDSLKATLGQGFINLFTPILKAINTLLGRLGVLADAFKSFTEMLTGNKASSTTASELSASATAAKELSSNVSGIGTAAKKAAKEMRSLAGIDELNNLTSPTSTAGSDTGGDASGASIDFGSLAQGESVIDKVDSKFQTFFEKMRMSLAPLSEQLQRFGRIAKNAFSWLMKNVLIPLGKFTINEVIPRFFKTLANILGIFNNILIALQPLWQWFWDNVLQPIASWAGGIFLSVWDSINDTLKQFSDWCMENPKAIETMAIIIGSFFAAFKIMSLVEGIGKLISIGGALIAKIGAFITACGGIMGAVTKIGGLIGSVLNPWIVAIGALIAAGVLLWKNWDTISVKAVQIWTSAKEAFQKFNSWLNGVFAKDWTSSFGSFGNILNAFLANVQSIWNSVKAIFNGITTFISGVFTGNWKKAWTGVKDILRGIFDLMVSQLKSPINLIIGLINSLLSKAVSGINSLIESLNKISFSVPDWVPEIGGKKFGFSIPQVSAPKIPYLAQGAYVKKNTPQLAIIGDNRHQGEIVAPEDKLEQMALKAAQMVGGNASQESISLMWQMIQLLREQNEILKEILQKEFGITGEDMFNITRSYAREYTKRTKRPAFP